MLLIIKQRLFNNVDYLKLRLSLKIQLIGIPVSFIRLVVIYALLPTSLDSHLDPSRCLCDPRRLLNFPKCPQLPL